MAPDFVLRILNRFDLEWYSKLNPRWLDLVGDYAGTERFVLDGDSLCQLVLDDHLLAVGKPMDNSFQILHAIWSVEKILKDFIVRRCNFEIVFFDDNRHVTMTSGQDADSFTVTCRSLARAIIQRHITHLEVAYHAFQNLSDPRWLEYVRTKKPMFVMCNDGTFGKDSHLLDDDGDDDEESGNRTHVLLAERALLQRMFIFDVLASGLAVASLKSAEFRDSKILTFVYEQYWRLDPHARGPVGSTAEQALKVIESMEGIMHLTPEPDQGQPVVSQESWIQASAINYMSSSTRSPLGDALFHLFIIHALSLESISLAERAQGLPNLHPKLDTFLREMFLPRMFAALARALASPLGADDDEVRKSWRPDLDGRIFLHLIRSITQPMSEASDIDALVGNPIMERVRHVYRLIQKQTGTDSLHFNLETLKESLSVYYVDDSTPLATLAAISLSPLPSLGVLPFENRIFDRHMSSVKVNIQVETRAEASDSDSESEISSGSSSFSDLSLVKPETLQKSVTAQLSPESSLSSQKTFRDDQHWHNGKKILRPHQEAKSALQATIPKINSKAITPSTTSTIPPWVQRMLDRSRQRLMSSIHRQAATLTGARGKLLQKTAIPPARRMVAEVITAENSESLLGVTTSRITPAKEKRANQGTLKVNYSKKVASTPKLSSADRLRQQIREQKSVKLASESEGWWASQVAGLEKLSSTAPKLDLLDRLERNKHVEEGWLYVEIKLYRIHLELQSWLEDDRREMIETRSQYAVSLLRIISDIYKSAALSKSVSHLLRSLLDALGLSLLDFEAERLGASDPVQDRPLHFTFTRFTRKNPNKKGVLYPFLRIPGNHIDFQLEHYGVYMDRSMDGAHDRRVSFIPDAWQRKVLDKLDQRESVLVVAPTSAGKTFISFYAMEQVLRESDDGVLVYVAPTKALVNQLAAEVSARFDKNSKSSGVWAAHTRDIRINDPSRCQILVTVPEMLSIMLLSPPLARVWTPKLRWIILDEIHSIGQQEGGAVWEQLILFAPCPIIGLSATIGNPEEFSAWLGSVQEQHGYKHSLIQHKDRYSHLRKFFYPLLKRPPTFTGLSSEGPHQSKIHFVHPISALGSGVTILPEDLALESRDCLSLYNAMKAAACSSTSMLSDLASLEPTRFFADTSTSLLKQRDILRYEKALKDVLTIWISKLDDKTIQTIVRQISPPTPEIDNMAVGDGAMYANLIHMLTDLHHRNDLPAILFNFDRHGCELIAQAIVQKLKNAQEAWRATSPEWKQKISRWEAWKRKANLRERAAERASKIKKDADDDPSAFYVEHAWEESFSPDDPSPGFTFAGLKTSYSKAEFESDINRLTWGKVEPWAIEALKFGVGVHHRGMNRGYQALVEILFRTGYLRVVIATGTLALGINMPVKTTVFAGDSVYLTALNFRQCAGRAGRRGFDLLGNVLFYGIPIERVHRLLTSRIPPLTGNMPLTTTLTLRLCNLLENSQHAPSAVRAIQSILELPQLSVASSTAREEILHHVRFSIDYLRRSGLLNMAGEPNPTYPIAAHLYHTEPSNLALVVLLRTGVLRRTCAGIEDNSYDTKRNLVALLCHLFGRRYLSRLFASGPALHQLRTNKSPSLVILPPIAEDARRVLAEHNNEILAIFKGYAGTYVTQHSSRLGPDNNLPLSGEAVSSSVQSSPAPLFVRKLQASSNANAATSTSAFVATSGITDASLTSIEDLTRTARSGLHLNNNAIPSMGAIIGLENENSLPLNSYIWDFFNHGQAKALEEANRVRRGDIWFALQDFSLAMATFRTGLEHRMKAAMGAADDAGEDNPGVEELDSDEGDNSDLDAGDKQPPRMFEAGSTALFPRRPRNVKLADWNIYRTVVLTKEEFDGKFKKMWA